MGWAHPDHAMHSLLTAGDSVPPLLDAMIQHNPAFAVRSDRCNFHFMDTLFPDPEALARVCRDHQIRRLALFGSMLKGTDGHRSDVDLLVEFGPGATPGLLGMAGIELELSALLNGRVVDLRTPAELSRHFRDEVAREARAQYAAWGS